MNNKASMDSIEMAPLEQNEKNLECDGMPYKVVMEEPKPHEINVSIKLSTLTIIDIPNLRI